ncbi:MAG: dihydrolipoyl dehydrogenase [Ignavibacteriae bacterium HGW-Ignavibacteriae-4]|jgi:dihydrolipoamide dehydrogenase|nr:MAG: dihydrolipoyl dehydrogenase [Ignavibacteriae bacterium HGW-Ignavibacteriae-4]
MKKYDFIVIGGGMAGMPIANKLAYKGYNTAIIEKDLLGGTCLNRGCIPTKTMLHSAKVAHIIRNSERFGVLSELIKIDFPAVIKRKDDLISKIRKGAYKQVENNNNLDLIEGEAKFLSNSTVQVLEKVYQSQNFIINTGVIPNIPLIKGLETVNYLTNNEILNLKELPKSLAILGGGYIGAEFAQMFARFGSLVNILQRPDRLVNNEDADISEVLQSVFEKEGINVHLNSITTSVENLKGKIKINYIENGIESTIIASHLLIATGRKSTAHLLDIENTGVDLNEKGFIKINSSYKTSQENIWAIGDITGNPMFTHSARDESEQLYQAITKKTKITKKIIPSAIFTDPEIASVGLTELQAISKGFSVKIGKQPFSQVARALAMGVTDGFVKIIINEKDHKILGAQIIGESAGELIHEFVLAINNKLKIQDIAKGIHIHPTLSEGVNSAAGGVHKPAGN